MTEAALTVPHLTHGKHNMASDAFAALRAARENGAAPAGQELGFSDLLDTLNPLQHIPVVAQIYRHVTGDTIGPAARVAGGALYGGPVGLIVSMIDAAVAEKTGSDIGEHMFAGLTGETPQTQIAAAPRDEAPATTPERAPAQMAAADPETTASIAKPAAPATAAPKPVPSAMPQLSSDAFNALMNSFETPRAAKPANPDVTAKPANPEVAAKPAPRLAATSTPSAGKPLELAPAKPAMPNDLAGTMQDALDQLEALRREHPEMPPVSAFAPPGASGL
ncbi:MAG: hypothetical protein WBG82_11125 [Parvibaculum sp.]|uniref:hypothetical protein n=1 Tax=Parvibaculum sp. TaxID=2024848 RepID=UPI003C74003A